jgi:ketosteroid isomerase-like protein
MSRENLDALRRVYAAWAEGDFWSGGSLLDPHIVHLGHWPSDPDSGPHYGLEAVTAYMRRFLDSRQSWRIEATDFRQVGDSVVVRVRRAGIRKSRGLPVEDEGFQVWTFRGGRVVWLEGFAQQQEALEAVGARKLETSQENVQLIRRQVTALARGDWEAVYETWDPLIEWDFEAGAVISGVYRGADSVRAALLSFITAWEDFGLEIEDMIAADGGRVVTLIRLTGRGIRSGIPLDFRETIISTIREGRVAQVKEYYDRQQALEAVGLRA